MKDFGKKLKSAREAKGLSLESVHSRLKITPYQLEALENMEPGKFHALVYFIGCLRRYAVFLGIDPNETINSYTQNLESAAQKSQLSIEKNEQKVSAKKQNSNNSVAPTALILIFAVVALLAISVPLAISIFGKIKPLFLKCSSTAVSVSNSTLNQVSDGIASCDTVKNTVVDEKENEKSSQGGQAENIKTTSQNSIFKRHNQEAYSINQGSVAAKAMQLKVVGLDNAWVRVISDKKALFEGTINKGAQRNFTANEKFDLRIGNEPGVEVYLNGRKVELSNAGKKINGKVKELEFTLKDINAKQ